MEFFYPETGWVPCDPALEDQNHDLTQSEYKDTFFAVADNNHIPFKIRDRKFYRFTPSPDLYFSILLAVSDLKEGDTFYKAQER